MVASLRISILAVVICALALGGCNRLTRREGYVVDPVLMNSIAKGVDNRESVEATLGQPTFVGQFEEQPQWFYVSRVIRTPSFGRPRPVSHQVLRVIFDDRDNVVAVERAGINLAARIRPEKDKTAVRGRDGGFLEDIFGNIGTVGLPSTGGGGQP